MTRRYLALILEFPDDEGLGRFQRGGPALEESLIEATTAAMLVAGGRSLSESGARLLPRVYRCVQHPHAPYVNDMTVRGLYLRPDPPPPEEDLTPEQENELLNQRSDEVQERIRIGRELDAEALEELDG